MKNFIQKGNVLTFVATTDVLSGELVLIGNSTLAVSTGSFKTGEEGEAILDGVVELPKKAGINWKTGDKVGVKMTDKLVTNSSGANVLLLGIAFNDVTDSDTHCHVKLTGQIGAL